MATEARRCPVFTGITSAAHVLYCVGRRCQPGRVRPTIGYCPTPAGCIAHSVTGAGPALSCDSGWMRERNARFDPGRNVATLIVGTIPLPGSDHLIAWPGGRDGRKLLTGPALPGRSGQVLAAAWAVRLSVPGPVLALAVEGVP
jgi:hypothetical protein